MLWTEDMNKDQLRWNNPNEHDENYHWVRHVYQRINFNISYEISKQKRNKSNSTTQQERMIIGQYRNYVWIIFIHLSMAEDVHQNPEKEADITFETLHCIPFKSNLY